jgi:hypothetical protein
VLCDVIFRRGKWESDVFLKMVAGNHGRSVSFFQWARNVIGGSKLHRIGFNTSLAHTSTQKCLAALWRTGASACF